MHPLGDRRHAFGSACTGAAPTVASTALRAGESRRLATGACVPDGSVAGKDQAGVAGWGCRAGLPIWGSGMGEGLMTLVLLCLGEFVVL